MKNTRHSLIALLVMLITTPVLFSQQTRVSPVEMESVVVAGDGVKALRAIVVYCRPYTKAPNSTTMRKIWGGLVPYGQVWRTGANEATLFITPVALEAGGATIPAGTYTLWTLPQADGSAKLIINKQFGQWGEAYDEKQDLARIDLTRSSLDKSVDQFTITMDQTGTAGTTGFVLKMAWENTQYTLPFAVKK